MPVSRYCRTQFYLWTDQIVEIQRRSQETGACQSEIARRLIARALELPLISQEA